MQKLGLRSNEFHRFGKTDYLEMFAEKPAEKRGGTFSNFGHKGRFVTGMTCNTLGF